MRQRSKGRRQDNLSSVGDVAKQEKCEERKIGPAPFLTLNWQDWYEMEVQVRNSIDNFLETIAAGQTNRAIVSVLDLQGVVRNMLEELYARGVQDGLETGPVV
ncbi:MAG TPA: hypothetical protein VFV38_03215 [Ktedonobacteraceae bacterium]|nr:hypothetical protein [Ktedonobacteraceae bacterium]